VNSFRYSPLQRYVVQPLATGLSIVALMACNSQTTPALTAANPDSYMPDPLEHNSTESSATLDLSNDALVAPSAPTLQITASPGELVLTWSEREDTESIAIYRYDASKGPEQKLDINIDPLSKQLNLPSLTHLRAWHRVQFRVEMCSRTDCISSQRVAIAGLTPQTLTQLKPSVFIKNERYAQDIASNDDTSVFAVTRPLEGAIDIHIKADKSWVNTQRLRFSNLPLSTTRQIHVALSANGDVIVASISDPANGDDTQIRILERLGEAWIETQQLQVNSPGNATEVAGTAINSSPNPQSTSDRALLLSASGDRLLLRIKNTVSLLERRPLGWSVIEISQSEAMTAENSDQITSSNLLDRYPVTMPLLAISASSTLHRLFTLHKKEQQIWLVQWQENTDPDSITYWQPGTPHLVSAIDTGRDIHLSSSDQGDKIAVAGWEDSLLSHHTPVMWRFSVNPDEFMVTGSAGTLTTSLTLLDSLRLAPTQHTQATLRFTADHSLENLAFGWQTEENADAGTLQDAHLFTYSYHPATRQWLTALELPEAIPTLAKQAFAGKVVMSANGNALLLGPTHSAGGPSLTNGGALVLH